MLHLHNYNYLYFLSRQHMVAVCVMLVVAALTVLMGDAFAATDDPNAFLQIDSTQITQFLRDLNPFNQGILKFLTGTGALDCPLTGSVTGLIANCMRETVQEATESFSDVFYDAVKPMIGPLMMLAVIFYGIEVALGDPEVKKKGFALLFRLGAVSVYSYDLGGNAEYLFNTMQAAQDIVTDSLMTPNLSSAIGLYSCPVGSAIGFFAGHSSNLVWARLDCIIMDLFGIGVDLGPVSIGNPNGLAGGLFGILLGLLFTGAFGVACFMFGLSSLLALVFFAMRVVYTFIISYVLVGFLIVIAPLMIPFLLFPKTMGSMFDKWWMNLAGAMALPAMLFAFLSVTLVMLDVAVFNDLNPLSLRSIASSDVMKKAYVMDKNLCKMGTLKDNDFYKLIKKADGSVVTVGDQAKFVDGPYKNFLTPTQSALGDPCEYFKVPTLDFSVAKDGTITNGNFLIRLAISLFTTMIVGMLTIKMYDKFATISVAIFGGGGGVLLSRIQSAPLQKEISSVAGSVGGAANKAASQLNKGISGMLMNAVRK